MTANRPRGTMAGWLSEYVQDVDARWERINDDATPPVVYNTTNHKCPFCLSRTKELGSFGHVYWRENMYVPHCEEEYESILGV